MPRGVWKPTWQHSHTPGRNPAGSGASRSQKYPVSADPNGCGFGGIWLQSPTVHRGGRGPAPPCCWPWRRWGEDRLIFPSIHGMKNTFYLTPLPVSTQSINAIQLFPTASFHPSPLPTSPWAAPAAPRSGFHAGRALQPPSPHLIGAAGWLTPSKCGASSLFWI